MSYVFKIVLNWSFDQSMELIKMLSILSNMEGVVTFDHIIKDAKGKMILSEMHAMFTDQHGNLYFPGQNLAADAGPKLFAVKYEKLQQPDLKYLFSHLKR